MQKILFFDTETTGFMKKGSSLESQPSLVQFGWIFWSFDNLWDYDEKKKYEEFNQVFDPGVHIPKQASDIHWITNVIAEQETQFPESWFWNTFVKLVMEADIVVWHNVNFDFEIMCVEIERLAEMTWWKDFEKWKRSFKRKLVCTMQNSIHFCNLPGGKFWKPKWARLSELHIKLFWADFEDAHDAFADIVATRDCYFALKDRGVIKDKNSQRQDNYSVNETNR